MADESPTRTEEELAAARAEYRRQARQNTGHALPADAADFDALLALADQLKPTDTEGIESIVEAAVRLDLNDIQQARLKVTIKNRTGVGLRPLDGQWKQAAARAAVENAPTPAEAVAMAAERQRQEQAERDAECESERKRLEPIVSPLAKDPKLIEHVIAAVAKSGVVGEERAVLAVFLAAVSRLHRRKCLSLLRRGAPASGKNFLIETVLNLLPKDSVIHVSSASPKALPYYGGADADALAHKIVYIPEASSLLVKQGVESEFTGMLRTLLISEGRIVHQTVVTRDDEAPITVEVLKNGPIACLVTSARANVEEELLTRMLFADSDETIGQSSRVMSSLLGAAYDMKPPPGVALFRDFQRWLELGGPYEVVVPYADAIRAAFRVTPNAIRIRRDLGNMLSAVFASAIAHKARREVDSAGKIKATLDDYKNAYDAFAPGLAAVYRPQLAPGVIALVRVLEGMIGAERKRLAIDAAAFEAAHPGAPTPSDLQFDGSVKATHSQLLKGLGIASKDAVGDRIRKALSEGLIEIIDSGMGKTYGLRYRVMVASANLTAGGGVSVFPTVEEVSAMEKDPGKRAAALGAITASEVAGDAVQVGAASPSPEHGDEDEEPV